MAGGRRGQRGLTRMDAALDHLGAIGFPKAVIRKKINELLKEYGGPDGWVFIEEASYSLVINQLVPDKEGSEDSEPGVPHLADAASQENVHGDAVSSSAAEPVNALANPSLNMVQDFDKNGSHQGSAVTSMDDVSFTQQDVTNNEDDFGSPGEYTPLEVRHASPLPPPHRQRVNQAPLSPPPPPLEMEYVPSPPEMEPSLPSVRRPCYGWWGGDETDVITLPEMPVRVKGAR